MKKILLLAAMAVTSLAASAQLHLNVGAETSHLWRGYEVSNGLNETAQLSYQAGGFQIGLWNGMTVTSNSYREFDYFASYTTGGFTVSLWDIYNYSPGSRRPGHTESEWMNIFNYNKYSTGHILDLGLAYNFGEACPLTLSWNTIIQGRDLDINKDGEAVNAYSSYVQAAYTVYEDENWTVTPSIGGTLKFAGETDGNFYSSDHKVALNDLRLAATYKLHVGNHPMPVTATAMWNPELKRGYMAVSVNLLAF